jgi:hypothetical protein
VAIAITTQGIKIWGMPLGAREPICMSQTVCSTSSKSHICLILMDPCIVDDSVEIPTKRSFVIECITPKFIEVSTCFEQHTAHDQEL